MDITPTSALAQPTTPPSNGAASLSDYDTFLKMLTVQMKNQDPLNPIDSADYAVQLATFSGVEQQTQTNQTLERLLGKFDVMGLAQLAGWVGNEVRSSAPVGFDGTPVGLTLPTDPGADRTVLAVRDASGVLVSREDVAPGTTSLTWRGASATGGTIPPGRYTLTVENYAEGTLRSSASPEAYQRVTEVQSGSDGVILRLAGGATIAASDVTALRGAGL